ncbi:MAG TPA: ABC transporter ATP-binding protein [Longimicrobiaceae bacterium]|nr:ABC transporter ATP-binding protein [Longimicrobiaceae bacterium]
MIRLTEVVKDYAGPLARLRRRPVRALDGVTLRVEPGDAVALVGPNGAGKSTLVRLLLGYLRPTHGTVEVGGLPPRAYVERHGVAYVPDVPAVPPGWTVRGALETYAALGEVAEAEARIEAVVERLGLAPLAERRVAALSRGNLQRLAIAQALLGPRRVMVLDEPTGGLDPEWTARFRELVAAWRAEDPERALLVSSHNLHEVERVADRVAVLEEGRVREVIDLRAPAAGVPAYRLEVEDTPGVAEAVRRRFPHAVAEDASPLAFRLEPGSLAELNAAVAGLIGDGAVVRALAPVRPTLEERLRAGRGAP